MGRCGISFSPAAGWPRPGSTNRSPTTKCRSLTGLRHFQGKNWRRPTLAESIQPLPSARLCLTAVFGMGTGRATASGPPKSALAAAVRLPGCWTPPGTTTDHSEIQRANPATAGRRFSENCTQAKTRITIRESNRSHPSEEGKKAIKPHDRLVLVR